MSANGDGEGLPRTEALRRALRRLNDVAAVEDLLFLEDWQTQRRPGVAECLRAGQIRRANPALAAEIHAELTRR